MQEINKGIGETARKIEALLYEFVEKNGDCDIKLSCQVTFEESSFTKKLVGIKVTMNIIV